MLPHRTGTTVVPSRNALRVLRQLAFAGTTFGGLCTVAAVNYDTHRRVTIAEKIVQNKRTIQHSAPHYNATAAAKKLSMMVEAAEAGEFDGLSSLKQGGWNKSSHGRDRFPDDNTMIGHAGTENAEMNDPTAAQPRLDAPSSFTHMDLEAAAQDLERATLTNSWLKDRSKAINFSVYDIETVGADINGQAPVDEKSTLSDDSINSKLDDGNSQTIRTIRDLFEKGRIIEAAEMFLETHLPTTQKYLSKRDRELAVNIFYANCTDENIWLAKYMFERIETLSSVSPRMWKTLVIVLTKSGALESASQLILRYREKIEIPYYLAELVVRCLLETYRFREAATILYKNIDSDKDCSLCGVFLHSLWKKSRSIDLVNREFEKMLSLLRQHNVQLTPKLFNPMLKTYVQFGRIADAEALANDMVAQYGVQWNCRTRGLLLLGQAFACNWKEVKDGLREMHKLGMSSDRSFVPVFTSLFLEYWPTHNATEIREFFLEAVEKHSLKPDQVLYEHVLQAYIQKGGPKLVEELAKQAQTLQWGVKLKDGELMETLQIQRRSVERSPVGFWQMLLAARIKHGQSASSQQVLGYDQRSLPWREANLIPHTNVWPNWYRRAMGGIMTDRPIDQYAALDKQMARYLHAGDYDSALWAFQNASAAGFVFMSYHVELGAIATLVQKGLGPTQKFVREYWEELSRNLPVVPVFFSQIMESDEGLSDIELIKLAVFRFYDLCWEMPNLGLKHHFMNGLAVRLIEKGQADAALDLLITVYKSRWGRQMKFDGTCMRALLRAFVVTGHLKGVRWCLLTAIARDSACNKDFVVDARRALVTGHLRQVGWAWRKDLRADFLKHLGTIVDILERKSKGDPELANLKNNKRNKRMSEKFYHPQVHRWHNENFASFQKLIAYWDEEREFEWVTSQPSSIFLTEEKTWKTWNQQNIHEREGEHYVE